MPNLSIEGFKGLVLDLISSAINVKSKTGADVFVEYNPEPVEGHHTVTVTIYEIGYIYQSECDLQVHLDTQIPEEIEANYKKVKQKIWEISQ